ncbi:MAG: hypothetical protein WKG01_13630 [Kofleriaceae bacterium]
MTLRVFADHEERGGDAELVELVEILQRHVVRPIVERQRDALGRRGPLAQQAWDPVEHRIPDQRANRGNHGV